MKKKTKKTLSAFLIAALLFSLLPSVAFASDDVKINTDNFPDEVFRGYVESFDTDRNGFLNEEELGNVSEINLFNTPMDSIQSFRGLEFFYNLTSLRIPSFGEGEIELDVSGNPALKTLHCQSSLKGLDLSGNPALETLELYNSGLTSLDLTKNPALKTLTCYYAKFETLDLTKNPALKNLNLRFTPVSTLLLSVHEQLQAVYLLECALTEVDVSGCPLLAEAVRNGLVHESSTNRTLYQYNENNEICFIQYSIADPAPEFITNSTVITFDSNGGEGEMAPVIVKAGDNYLLPECGFTAPENRVFDRWELRDPNNYVPGREIFSYPYIRVKFKLDDNDDGYESILLIAQWKDVPAEPQDPAEEPEPTEMNESCFLCGETHDTNTVGGFFVSMLHDFIYIVYRLARFFCYDFFISW